MESTDSRLNELNDNMAEIDSLPYHGLGLCLSGGGYRAMLFHLGALWRLNELGLLPQLDRISSVSGGSIIAAYLGMKWNTLNFDPSTNIASNFQTAIVDGIRSFAGKTIDWPSVIKGILCPGSSIAQEIAKAYDDLLFHGATLQDLPDKPRFVINASNLQSGVLWRFSKPYMADWKVGMVKQPKVPLAVVVAASSAFPPFLSPVRLNLRLADFAATTPPAQLQHEPFATRVLLADGGVYDNLGLETVFKELSKILVSDGGQGFSEQPRPWRFWPMQLLRVLLCIDNQVRSLRERDLVRSFQLREKLLKLGMKPGDWVVQKCSREGAYWGITTNASKYPTASILDCPPHKTLALAGVSTRLEKIRSCTQEKLINWGYAVSDSALRAHFLPNLGIPISTPIFPYNIGVG
jgi:NTE family protein